jgi:hypothetical protein
VTPAAAPEVRSYDLGLFRTEFFIQIFPQEKNDLVTSH